MPIVKIPTPGVYPAYIRVTAVQTSPIAKRTAVARNTGFLVWISEMGDSTIGPKANPAVKVVMPIEAATTLTFHSAVNCRTAGPYEPTAELDSMGHVHKMAVTRTLR